MLLTWLHPLGVFVLRGRPPNLPNFAPRSPHFLSWSGPYFSSVFCPPRLPSRRAASDASLRFFMPIFYPYRQGYVKGNRKAVRAFFVGGGTSVPDAARSSSTCRCNKTRRPARTQGSLPCRIQSLKTGTLKLSNSAASDTPNRSFSILPSRSVDL